MRPARIAAGGEDVLASVVGGDEPGWGRSSCMLVNGKETIWPSDKGKQRPCTFCIYDQV